MKKKDEFHIRPSQQVYNKKLRDLEMPIITKNEKFLLFCGFVSESREKLDKIYETFTSGFDYKSLDQLDIISLH